MTDEHRPRPHWTDERLTDKFSGIERSIDSARSQNVRDNAALKADFDEKHKVNQADIAKLDNGQAVMQGTLNSIDSKSSKSVILLTQIVGEGGKPDEGRLGKLEATVEVLKKFRWQLIAGASMVVMLLKIFKVL